MRKHYATRALSLALALVLALGSIVMLNIGATTVHAEAASDTYDPNHSCIAYMEDEQGDDATIRVTSADMGNAMQMINELRPGDVVMLCLAESVDLGSVPFTYTGAPGSFVVLCTGGGCDIKGTVINPTDDDGRVVGGLFALKVDMHSGFGHESDELIAVDSGYVEFIEANVNYAADQYKYGPYTAVEYGEGAEPTYGVQLQSFALLEDIVITDPMWAITEEIAALAADQLPVVICKNGHELTISDEIIKASVPGAFKIVDCVAETPHHTCGVLDDDSIYLCRSNIQSFADQMSSISSGDTVNIWLASDIDVGALVIPTGVTVNVCLNGYDLTYTQDPEMAGGVLNILDCTTLHWCHSAAQFTDVLCSGTASSILDDIASAQSGDRFLLHLGEDIVLDAQIPEGVIVGICKNEHTLGGSIVNNESVYVYDCDMHICPETDSCIVYIDQAWADMNTVTADNISMLQVTLNGATLVPTENIVLPEGTIIGMTVYGLIDEYFSGGNKNTIDTSLLPSVQIGQGEYTISGLVSDGIVVIMNHEQTRTINWSRNDMSYTFEQVNHTETTLLIGNGEVIYTTGKYAVTNGTDLSFVYHDNEITDKVYDIQSGKPVGENSYVTYVPLCGSTSYHNCKNISDAIAITPGIGEYLFAPDGTLRLNAGKYNMYLAEDVVLVTELHIPFGVEMDLCLNGHSLTARFYEGSSSSGWYYYDPTSNMMRPYIMVGDKPGWESSDRSLETVKTTVCTRDTVYRTVVVDRGAALTITDCRGTGSLSSPINADGTSAGTSECLAADNSGSLRLENVNSRGAMTAVSNSGSLEVSGGMVAGMLAGIVQGSENASIELSDGATVAGTFFAVQMTDGVLSAENSEIVSAIAGIAATDGEVSLEDCSIYVGNIGVVGYEAIDFGNVSSGTGASVVISGGEMNIGNTERVGEIFGIELGKDDLLDIGIFGGVASGELTIVEDFLVKVDPLVQTSGAMNGATVFDIALTGGAKVTVGIDTKLNNVYTVVLLPDKDGNYGSLSAILPENGYNNFVGANGYGTTVDENGDYVVVLMDPSSITASGYGWELSADGSYIGTYYVALTDEFVNDSSSVLVIEYKGQTLRFGADDLFVDAKKTASLNQKGVTVYGVRFEMAPKDYKERVVYHFENSALRWSFGSISLDTYFDGMLSSDNTPEITAFITALKNNCMAASEKFKTTDVTADEVGAAVGSVVAEMLERWKRVTSGEMKGFKMLSATLLLEERCAMRFYFELVGDTNIDSITVTVDGVQMTPVKFNNSGCYYIEVDGVGPAALGAMRQITIGEYSFTYSPLTYVYNLLSKSEAYTDSDINIAVSLYNAYVAAQAYLAATGN